MKLLQKIIQRVSGFFIDKKVMTKFQDGYGKFLFFQYVKTCKRCGHSRPEGGKIVEVKDE